MDFCRSIGNRSMFDFIEVLHIEVYHVEIMPIGVSLCLVNNCSKLKLLPFTDNSGKFISKATYIYSTIEHELWPAFNLL